MSKLCPLTNDIVLYLDCMECEEKTLCKSGFLSKKKSAITDVNESQKNDDNLLSFDIINRKKYNNNNQIVK